MRKLLFPILILSYLTSCVSYTGDQPFQPIAEGVDINRFLGDWFVIALLPTPMEKSIANGVENYSLRENGEIRVTYTFRKGNPSGREKVMYQRGWIVDTHTNAEWRVRPLWPLKLPYYILEVGDDYSYTVIGTNKYDYLWIMSREPSLEPHLLEEIIRRMEERGYSMNDLVYMEQNWEGRDDL